MAAFSASATFSAVAVNYYFSLDNRVRFEFSWWTGWMPNYVFSFKI
jgi:hypothetical protein